MLESRNAVPLHLYAPLCVDWLAEIVQLLTVTIHFRPFRDSIGEIKHALFVVDMAPNSSISIFHLHSRFPG